uniref:cholecystokinin receptor type A-like isoform X1 n=1 Tax=Styela clava TaxID=7725 RepID=UPI001939731C|nr:cholecystokinin receptor type A-like isoform X1 [Styela clava]
MRPHKCIGNIAVPITYNETDLPYSTFPPFPNSTEWMTSTVTSSIFDVTVEDEETRSIGGKITGTKLAFIICYSIVLFLATVGNLFVIATLVMNKRMGTVTNFFLLSLAVSDLLMALVCIPVTLIGQVRVEFMFGLEMCKVMLYLMGVSVAISTFTMLAISLERYYAICRPLHARGWQTKSHACKVILGIWIFSFLIMLPFAVYSTIKMMPLARRGICIKACRVKFPDEDETSSHSKLPASHKIWYLFQLIALLIIPGVLMTVAYGLVCKTIYKGFQVNELKQKQGNQDVSGNSTPRTQRTAEHKPESHRLIGLSANGKECVKANDDSNTSANSEHTKGFKKFLRTCRNPKSLRNGVSKKEDSRKNETRKQLQAKKKVVEMLIVIVILFFACWTPTFVVNVWKSFDPQTARRKLQSGIIVIQILPYVSTCVNPVVYCFLNKRFRQAFLNIFCICCGCLPEKWRPKRPEFKTTFRQVMSDRGVGVVGNLQWNACQDWIIG